MEGRGGDEKKGGGTCKEKRSVLWSLKILKIDPDERLYLFKRMTYVRQHQAESDSSCTRFVTVNHFIFCLISLHKTFNSEVSGHASEPSNTHEMHKTHHFQ